MSVGVRMRGAAPFSTSGRPLVGWVRLRRTVASFLADVPPPGLLGQFEVNASCAGAGRPTTMQCAVIAISARRPCGTTKGTAMHRLSWIATTVAVTDAPVQRNRPTHTAAGTATAPPVHRLRDEAPAYVQAWRHDPLSWDRYVILPGCTSRDDAAIDVASNEGITTCTPNGCWPGR